MKLYLVSRVLENALSKQYVAAVVAAPSPIAASRIHPNGIAIWIKEAGGWNSIEERGVLHNHTWIPPEQVKVQALGRCGEEIRKPSVILAHFIDANYR